MGVPALAVAAPNSSPTAKPTVGKVTTVVERSQPGADRAIFAAGYLTDPSQATPEAIAARYLDTSPAVLAGANPGSLVLDKVTDLGRGHVLRYRQTHRGLPVIGGTTVVRVDDAGVVRWVNSGAREIPSSMSLTPMSSARQAFTRTALAAGYEQEYADALASEVDRRTELAVYVQPNMAEPRLVYWVELPLDMTRLMTIRAYVDAETGFIYRMENLVVHADRPQCASNDSQRAYVFETNPVATPDLACVSLSDWLPADATHLANADVVTGNCVDNLGCREVNLGLSVDLHWCDDDPTATANRDGDFTDYMFESHADPEDDFAEVQMFYHVNKAYDKARELGGFTNLNAHPIDAVVNFRLPFEITAQDPLAMFEQACFGDTYFGGRELYAFDNAFFAPAGALAGYPDGDAIVFGQGTAGDFAYDGDVVYHEFGHALMHTVAPDLAFAFIDRYGFNPMPGGMHEGYADLMTMFVTDDPEIGEYAGGMFDLPAIRNIDNDVRCPEGLVGETHIDSLPLTGAMWQARLAVATSADAKRCFDEAVFAAQQTFTEFEDFETAAAKTVVEIEAALGADAAATVESIFAERGLNGCNKRVVDGRANKSLMLVGTNGQGGGPSVIPAPVQFSYDLPGGADTLSIDIESVTVYIPAGLGGEPALEILLKKDEEIHWTIDENSISSDHTAAIPVDVDPETGVATATFQGSLEAGTYYAQLTVDGGSLILRNMILSHTGGVQDPSDPTAPTDPIDPSDPTAPTNPVDPTDPIDDPAPPAGCSVADGIPNDLALAFVILGIIALVHIRRRRRD